MIISSRRVDGIVMDHPRKGCRPEKQAALFCAITLSLCIGLFPDSVRASDITFSAKTYLQYRQQDVPGDTTKRYAPLYEYLSGDFRHLGDTSFSFHFSGWGRADLKDASGNGTTSGDLGNAYLQYLHPTGNGEMRLGRFFLTEGTAMEIMDGVFLKGRTAVGIGASLFGGVPAEDSITATKAGDSIYGGRLFYAKPGVTELGVSYLQEKGSYKDPGTLQEQDRTEIGGDLWLRPAGFMEVIGRAAYNNSTQALASQRYLLRLTPPIPVDLSFGYETYKYKDLFQTALNPAFQFPSLDMNDMVRTAFAILDWEIAKNVTVTLGAKNIKHDSAAVGDANRGEAGIKFTYNNLRDAAGITVAMVNADRDENTYQEYRGYATYSPAKWRFSLDALTQQYKQAINEVTNAYHVVGSVGYQVTEILRLSGDLIYTKSPRFEKDYAGFIRASLLFGTRAGEKK